MVSADDDEIIGTSTFVNELRAQVSRVAQSDAKVLITGETGTGKEMVARAIHACSHRAGFAFAGYYRLNVIRITVPPLRERGGDVALLVDHFLTIYSERHRTARPRFSRGALDALLAHSWPGNVRELKNVIERVVLRTDGHEVTPLDLPPEIFPHAAAARSAPAASASRPLADALATRMIGEGESFWTAVHPQFVARNLTCDDVRAIVGRGLALTNGNYRSLVKAFNMPSDDYKRFLRFLRKHHCNLPFQPYRAGAAPH